MKITPRELRQSDRRFRTSTDAAEAHLKKMGDLGYGRMVSSPPQAKGGRPTVTFYLDDAVYVYETQENNEENGGFVDVDSVDTPTETTEWTS